MFRRQRSGPGASVRGVKWLFLKEARREYPLWWNPHLNPPGVADPQTRFKDTLANIHDVLNGRNADAGRTLEVLEHLLRTWPGGTLSYNAWWLLHTAQIHGILDQEFMPVTGAPYIDETARLHTEIKSKGGPGALAAYRNVMESPNHRRSKRHF